MGVWPMKKLMLAATVLCLAGCVSVPKIYRTPETKLQIAASEKMKAERKTEALSYALEEKAAIFEQQLNNFYRFPYLLLPEYKTEKDPRPGHAEQVTLCG